MSIIVINGFVRHAGKRYGKNETITSLSEKEEARLVSLGVAEYCPKVEEVVDDKDEESEKDNIHPVLHEDESNDINETDDIASESVEDLKIDFNADEVIQISTAPETPKKNRK